MVAPCFGAPDTGVMEVNAFKGVFESSCSCVGVMSCVFDCNADVAWVSLGLDLLGGTAWRRVLGQAHYLHDNIVHFLQTLGRDPKNGILRIFSPLGPLRIFSQEALDKLARLEEPCFWTLSTSVYFTKE